MEYTKKALISRLLGDEVAATMPHLISPFQYSLHQGAAVSVMLEKQDFELNSENGRVLRKAHTIETRLTKANAYN